MHALDDTIVAIASPPGGAARGIVRLSGPEAVACFDESFRADDADRPLEPTAAVAVPGSLCLDEVPAPLPCELYVWPAGRSYTGQPVAEIHTIGSPPLLEAVVGRFCRAGARLAEPGEFTLRAFLAGRIDLTQAEAVLGVVDAADPRRLDVALNQLAGGLAGPLHRLRDSLLDLLAHLEAGLDFADEDLPFIESEELSTGLAEASREVARIVRQMAGRTETGRHIRAVLTGSPNTGKSSLFNALSGGAGALVSPHPGTTRDYLTAELDLDGVGCQLIDTAGVELGADLDEATLDDALGTVDDTARAVASRQTRQAHLRILCIDSTRRMNPGEREELAGPVAGQRVVVLTKTAAVLQEISRAGDLVARYGGEEFVILCPDCGIAAATIAAVEIGYVKVIAS